MNEELKKMLEEMNDSYKQLAASNASKEDLAAIKTAMDNVKNFSEDEVKKLNEIIVTQGEAIKDLENGISGGNEFESEFDQIKHYISENIDEIKGLYKNKGKQMEFEVKAVGNMTTSSGAMIDQPRALGPISNPNMRSANLVNLCSVSSTNLPSFPYVDTIPKDGVALNVAEGTAKPQVDFKWEVRFSNPTKVAAFEIITEEASQDVANLMSVAKNYLRKRHDIAIEKDIYFGDGTAPNSEGATVLARAFNAGGMALKVATPNFIDAIFAAIVDIQTTHNYADEDSYYADVVLVNPIDFFINYSTAKDGMQRPLYPQASTTGSVTVGQVTIYQSERIPAGKIFVADMSKYNLKKYKSYTVRIGWHNDDFIKNQFVMVGESRYHAYVKHLDKAAFIYDDLATIIAAITKA
ncbi:MAG: phage major capsid protein [Chlamydiia bacterium]|nr:phage major capsid protein [Chlamydiia bacterium]